MLDSNIPMQNSTGLNILITGGTDGLGLKLVESYAKKGANIITTGREAENNARPKLPASVTYIQADQTNPRAAAEIIKATFETLNWTKCDLAILNAGAGYVYEPLSEDINKLKETLAVNLYSPIQISLAIAPAILLAGGQLTFIGSVAHKGAEKFASYSAAKAGQHGFIRALSEEWRGRAIAQIIHPGAMMTNMHTKADFNVDKIRFLFTPLNLAARAVERQISKGITPVTVGFGSRIWGSFTSWRNN